MLKQRWIVLLVTFGLGAGIGVLATTLIRTPPYFQRVKITSVATLPTALADVTQAAVRFDGDASFTPLANDVDDEPGQYGSTRWSWTAPNSTKQVTSFVVRATIGGTAFTSLACDLPSDGTQWFANYIDVMILGVDREARPLAIWRGVRRQSWADPDDGHTGWSLIDWER